VFNAFRLSLQFWLLSSGIEVNVVRPGATMELDHPEVQARDVYWGSSVRLYDFWGWFIKVSDCMQDEPHHCIKAPPIIVIFRPQSDLLRNILYDKMMNGKRDPKCEPTYWSWFSL